MADVVALCTACGAPKDLPLGRCGACAHLPLGGERELAVICSARMLDPTALAEVQTRIRRGEAVRPSAERRTRARALLSGAPPVPMRFSGPQLVQLAFANLIFTPLLGYAVWFRYRTRPGPAGGQALLVTVPLSVVLFVALVGWRVGTMRLVGAPPP